MKFTPKTLVIGMWLSFLLLMCLSSSAHADEPLADAILKIVAGEQNIEQSGLQIATIEARPFPLTGITLYQAKVVNTATGEVYRVVVDETATKQDVDAARNAELAAYQDQYGSLDPALYERLQTMADDERLMVTIWLRADNVVFPERPDVGHKPAAVETGDEVLPSPAERPQEPPESLQEKTRQEVGALGMEIAAIRAQQTEQRQAIEAARQSAENQLAKQMTVLQQPLLAALAAEGFAPVSVSSTSPLVYVELPKSAILELAQRADIASIYGPNENFPEMSSAKPAQKANVVDSWGFDGSGVDMAILERERIQFDNPWLNAGTTRDINGTVDADGGHATAAAGIVASQNATHQGIAQGVSLFSANATTWDDADVSAAMQWAAVTQNVDVINNSWGGNVSNTDLNVHDRHLDYIVRYEWSTVIKSAGNEADGCRSGTGRVTSPGRGYNVITVGNYQDQNTLTWDDDAMDSCSSFVNPSTLIEKPEVAAVGSSINSTTLGEPWIDDVGSGTSLAAPMVAGEAALLMDRVSSLTILPEAVKAIIMATALHNIEGNSRLSDRDGAGGVDMRAAFRVVDEGWWDWRSVNSSSFPYNYTVYAYAGEMVRAAIAWDSNPAADYSTDPLEANLDMRVYAPSGGYVAGSFSHYYSYEIVEFTAPETGNYELRIDAPRFDGTTEYVGAAWWPGHRVLTAYTPQTLNTPPIVRDYYRFNADIFWNAVGIRPPSGSDYDIYLYANSAFGDPDDYDWLEDSTLGGSSVDFVLVDRNHAPTGSYYPEIRAYSGSGNYPIEWATHSGDITAGASGTFGPFTMSANSVVRIWDIQFGTDQERKVVVRPTNGTADLGVALFDSDPGNSASLYQGRSQAVAAADANGTGVGETLEYTNSGLADWMGLVVYNNSLASTTFYLDVDLEPLAVTTPYWDDIGSVLTQMGYSWTQISDTDLINASFLSQFDVVFANCNPYTYDYPEEASSSLQQFVQNGGSFYASDFAYTYIKAAFPGYITFHDGPHVGLAQWVTADVVDPGLANYLDPANPPSTVDIEYDLDYWVPIKNISSAAKVHYRGTYSTLSSAGLSVSGKETRTVTRQSESVYALAQESNKPLCVSFEPYGDGGGRVIYTTFHNEPQQTEIEKKLLEYLVLIPSTSQEQQQVRQVMDSQKVFLVRTDINVIDPGEVSPLSSYMTSGASKLVFALAWRGSTLRLSVYRPNGSLYSEVEGSSSPIFIAIPDAEAGSWKYKVTGVDVPYNNYPYVVGIGEPGQKVYLPVILKNH